MRHFLIGIACATFLVACGNENTGEGAKFVLACTTGETYTYCNRLTGCSERSNDGTRGPYAYQIDLSAKTVDGKPAQITETTISWGNDVAGNRHTYSINRYTKEIDSELRGGDLDSISKRRGMCQSVPTAF